MIEITFGGSNAPICHGSGVSTKTLSDYIYEIEFVNCLGNIQRVSADNPDGKKLLRSAAGAFGLIGITTHLTYKLDKMTHANFVSEFKDPFETIPVPQDERFYKIFAESFQDVQEEYKGRFDQIKNKFLQSRPEARKKFIDLVTKNYYNEFFWFPFHHQFFTVNWNNDGDPAKSENNGLRDFVAELGSFFNQLCNVKEDILE